MMGSRGEQFHSMYTNPVWFRKIFQDCTHRAVYKHWNRWCYKKGHMYCFDKGYDEDYAKNLFRDKKEMDDGDV